MKKFTIGIDIGGTNIKFGLVSPKGRVIYRSRLNTRTLNRNKKKLINAIIKTVQEIIDHNKISKSKIKGIGFGLPGLIDPQKGVVKFLPNIPGWRDVPLKKLIEKKLHIPTYLENDVNLICLGEWKYGAGKGYKNCICMTLGTGVGGGLILNNALYRGEGFVAGELGHMPLNEKGKKCNCGGFGCFESYVGNQVLVKRAEKIFMRKSVTIEDTYRLANKGDKRALRFWKETATHIGNGLVGVVNLLNPKLIIIGGGVSNNYKFLHKTVRDVLKKRAMKVQAQMVEIKRAKLGDDAGIIGALVLVKDKTLGR